MHSKTAPKQNSMQLFTKMLSPSKVKQSSISNQFFFEMQFQEIELLWEVIVIKTSALSISQIPFHLQEMFITQTPINFKK
jgi:hypothetical protein